MRAIIALAIAFVGGCGGDGRGGGGRTHTVEFDVGGFVAYQGEPDVGLPSVAVTLLDADGETYSATSGSSGLWSIDNLKPGVYTERYELAGYEPVTGAFALEAFGENDVSNPFVARPPILMEDMRLRVTISPFGALLENGDELFDGVGSNAFAYSNAQGEPVVLVFNMVAAPGSLAILDDMTTFDFVVGGLDSSGSVTTISILGSQIAAMNSGEGLTPSVGLEWNRLRISASAQTPVHGELVALDAAVWFSTLP
jgi:hypothetical protein